ncbi:MAG: TolC family protein [Tepidisphaeraceae bacterium]
MTVTRFQLRPPPWWGLLTFCLPGLVLVTGCQRQLPPDDVAQRVSSITAVEEPIQFSLVGEDIDARHGNGSSLTLEQAVRSALKHDAGVQAALARVRVALADAKQARLLPNPVLSVVVRFPEGGGKTQIDAGLSADLLALLQTPRRIDAADNRLRGSAADVLVTAIDLVSDVQERYAAAQAADAELAVLRERQRLIARLLDLARSRLAVGESSRLDVITLDAERVSLDVEITQALSSRREERLALARLIAQPSGPIDWELTPWTPDGPVAVDEPSWIRAALEHRPEIESLRWELAALGDDAALARFAAFDGAEVGVEAERDDDWSVGPAIATPLPLFDWGYQRRAKVDAQRIEARHKLTQARRQVVEEVRRALESIMSSQAALKQVQAELIPLSDQRVEQAEAAYKNGLADVTALLLAQQEAQAARSKLIELQQKASSAVYRLHRAVGGPGVAVHVPATTPTTAPSTKK